MAYCSVRIIRELLHLDLFDVLVQKKQEGMDTVPLDAMVRTIEAFVTSSRGESRVLCIIRLLWIRTDGVWLDDTYWLSLVRLKEQICTQKPTSTLKMGTGYNSERSATLPTCAWCETPRA